MTDYSVTVDTTTYEATVLSGAGGDMFKSIYDTDSNGIVDKAEQLNDGTNTVTAEQARDHIDDTTIHFTVSSIDHTLIQNIGTNTHTQIDSHIASTSNPHNVQATQITDFDTEVSNNVDVLANSTHRTSDGKSHSDVILNNTHRTSNGTDHTYINQDLTTTASPTFSNISVPQGGKVYFEGAASDTYIWYNKVTQSVQLFVNGNLSWEFG